MAKLSDIKISIEHKNADHGDKTVHPRSGFSAVKNGIKKNVKYADTHCATKPSWLKAKIPAGKDYQAVKNIDDIIESWYEIFRPKPLTFV